MTADSVLMDNPPHIPVLLDEVITALAIHPGERHVDATFGAGGYTRAMLAKGAMVHGFDRDPDARPYAEAVLSEHGEMFRFHPAEFSQLDSVLREAGIEAVDGIVFDIGVSSMQLDRPERGFSFREDGPLDMRMAQSGESAADFLNSAEADAIADVLYLYGEERQSRRVARAICAARPLQTTAELAAIIRKALGHHPGMKKDPATRSFQAIRIHVNGEMDELRAGLTAAEAMLKPGGRLAVVTFHSLEDRIVKQFFRTRSGRQGGGSRHLPVTDAGPQPSFGKPAKAIRAGDEECARNPRARSATLRAAIRTDAPTWKEAA
ncbi:16S rRNA (cytosine(1402)-N(4))-methyltransferase RsmH [Alterisphingorhabdus coralli]|uniref:Ribosomal RNA small subunit methyltransferase H n=1 Tax=Alterisphingorhabdus coralli TaxID=3071408 RepID=A0AA97I2W7_9SPHN|nr:16S rRNA (cytosine(1402)-N(4))-methyltransferase RsmH [Parasphingorhabdus sp. SCSIO 66989]WOE76145.1 16S rRNA (cytosine(1402)-N(4))-methyltransferase RsmH [Parasphingorhabdus sp. SCSIO 66989]